MKTNKKIDGHKEEIRVLYLAPHVDESYGYNACPKAGKCAKSCLQWSGRMAFHTETRTRKTRAFMAYTSRFVEDLVRDIALKAYQSHINNYKLWIRLNGTTDFMWEKFIHMDKLVADLQGLAGFYDYTKLPLRSRRPSKHYHLSFSVDEQLMSVLQAMQYMKAGFPAVVVLNKDDYKEALALPNVVDGDKDDARFHDGSNVVVLKAKRLFGDGKYVEDGLVRSLEEVKLLCRY